MPLNRRSLLKSASLVLPFFATGCGDSPADPPSEPGPTAADEGLSAKDATSDIQLEGRKITVDLPLIETVYALDAELRAKFPTTYGDWGIGQMGLLLNDRWLTETYWCTPRNSICFGHTGGDGAHFSFLVPGNRIDENTPVLISVPDAFGEHAPANAILGRNFLDFVRLGLHCGYFSMAQFAHSPSETLEHYARTDWDNGPDWFPSENFRAVAEHVSKSLDLSPLSYTREEFDALQAEFKPLLHFGSP